MPAKSAVPSTSMSPPDSPEEHMRGHGISPGDWPGLVARVEGTQLVIGGPGTGKTELLARRAAHLINSGIATSDGVLAISFSRETAADLRERITGATRRSFGELSVGTFYAFALALVEAHSGARPPLLLTTPEQIRFVRKMLSDEDPGQWPLFYRRMLGTRTLAEEVAEFMLRCGEQRITPADLAVLAMQRPAWRALPGFYERYVERLRCRNKTDYTGLLLLANQALGKSAILGDTVARFPYLLVDEYQEATPVQIEILKKLVGGGCHLTAVADPQQTSFSFRGAERASVSAFPKTFAATGERPPRIFTLATSFRVPAQVLDAAGALIKSDPAHLLPVPAPRAGRVELWLSDQEAQEGDWIASEIKRLHFIEQLPFSRMAVITRASRLLPRLSRALDRQRIPHARPGARLIDHPAVRLVLDLAWAAAVDTEPDDCSPEQTAEVDLIVESALLGPLFTMTRGRARELVAIRRRDGLRWSEVLAGHSPGARALAGLLGDPAWAKTPPATNGFWRLWSSLPQFRELVESDLLAGYRSALASFAQTLGRLAERSLHTSLLDYRKLTLEGDLEASPLLPLQSRQAEQVTISTIHQVKGRQFDVVFIAGATDGVFPDTRPYTSLLEGQFLSRPNLDRVRLVELRLEEERSLAYTAMTRASRRVIWTATSPDLNEAQHTVSRFLFDLRDGVGLEFTHPTSLSDDDPVGLLETESYLRRTQRDIEEPPPRRLAAAAVLVHPPRHDLWDTHSFAGVPRRGSDTGLIDEGHVMSASQAHAYQTCPRRYALGRRLRLDSQDNHHATFGQLMHRVLEESGRRAFHRGEPCLDLSDALEELGGQMADLDFGTPVLNSAWLEKGMRLLSQLAERTEDEGGHAIRFEAMIDAELDGVRWRGRIDRIDRLEDGSLRVIDYKTSKNPMAIKEAAASLQLGFYLWGLSHLERDAGQGVPVAEFWYPLCDKESSWKRSFDTSSLEEVVKSLGEIAEVIISEKADPLPWPPKPSKECQRCRVRPLCPAWPEGQGAFL